MIIPQAIVVAGFIGGSLYDPPEIHRQLEKHIFFQGNTDWGGGCLFAGTIALYVAFGFTAAWHLVFKLQEVARPSTFSKNLLKAVWFLKFHIIAFIIGSDGNTARAGQLVQSGEDPEFKPRSARHRMMLGWHETRDTVLGPKGKGYRSVRTGRRRRPD